MLHTSFGDTSKGIQNTVRNPTTLSDFAAAALFGLMAASIYKLQIDILGFM